MLIANYDNEITDEVFRLHDGSFPFPNCSDPNYIQKKILIHEGRIIGAGFIRLTTELTLILNKNESLRTRVDAIKELEKKITCNLRNKGIKDIHIFCNDPSVAKFARHFGFQNCPEKEALSLLI